ncbi:MAG: hypothetical protein JKY93_00255 [Gammaproteobacteria bacterium]|nr:hypothetical protein [Gammaproteobacteria bacterium]
MRVWARFWGLLGVTVFLMSAVIRVLPSWEEVSTAGGPLTYALLVFLLAVMGYLEGYRGFYKGFSPRVVSRSKALTGQTKSVYWVLAPLFCMGFIGSSRLRKVGLIVVTLCIVGLVFWVKGLPQPWRWVIDLSVAVALFGGTLSIIWLAYRDWDKEGYLCDPEIPGMNDKGEDVSL